MVIELDESVLNAAATDMQADIQVANPLHELILVMADTIVSLYTGSEPEVRDGTIPFMAEQMLLQHRKEKVMSNLNKQI